MDTWFNTLCHIVKILSTNLSYCIQQLLRDFNNANKATHLIKIRNLKPKNIYTLYLVFTKIAIIKIVFTLSYIFTKSKARNNL